ncbi:hypothetical protein ACIBCB_20080 [Streptomyces uncialis]|uniref:hypothetical protein n=1 Tax=Streptomyces uncialis TaxID=1048205 RepID=UPI00378B9EA3
MPFGIIAWATRRSDRIVACLAQLKREYVSAVDDGRRPVSAARAPSGPVPGL